MALHKLLVDDFYDESYSLIAVHCRLADYRLAYLLNLHLDLKLERKDKDLDYNYFAASFPIYEWENASQYVVWNLIANQHKREEDSLQSSGSLFETNKVYKTYRLLPELKNVDYLIKISHESNPINEKIIINKLQNIPQVITTYTVDTDQLKSKDNLIF